MFTVNVYNQPNKSEIFDDYEKAQKRAIYLRELYKTDIFIDDELTGDTIDHYYA